VPAPPLLVPEILKKSIDSMVYARACLGKQAAVHWRGRNRQPPVHAWRIQTKGITVLWTWTSRVHKLVIDDDALSPCQLYDLADDPLEDHDRLADPDAKPVADHLMETLVRPFFSSPPARPHASIFTRRR
jgi:hypothetical protein